MKLFAALLCASLVGACRSSTAPPPDPLALAGTYDLTTVNGSALPFVVQEIGQPGSGIPKVEILSNQMIVGELGQFTLIIVERISSIPGDGTLSIPDGGRYTVDSTAKRANFTFNSEGNANVYPAALASGEFTVAIGPFAERFVKQ